MATGTRGEGHDPAQGGPRSGDDVRFEDVFTDTGAPKVDPDTIRRLHRFAELLDDRFRIPGTDYRIGIDGLIGMVPGIGDTASALIASYVVLEAYRLEAPPSLLARMAANIGIDWILGSVPVAGDIFDFAWKANRKNVRLLLEHLQTRT